MGFTFSFMRLMHCFRPLNAGHVSNTKPLYNLFIPIFTTYAFILFRSMLCLFDFEVNFIEASTFIIKTIRDIQFIIKNNKRYTHGRIWNP